MLTFEDCIGLANLEKDEVAAIAEHERLPFMTALEKGAMLLLEPWGDAAIRQIVWDNLCRADDHRRPGRVEEMSLHYRVICDRHPNPCDRRHSPVRPSAPLLKH